MRPDLSWATRPALLAVNGLAAYRLTRLWLRDSVPPMPAVRAWLGDRLTEHEDAHEGRPHPLAPLTDCPWCAGFWISLGVVGVASVPALRRAWLPLATALAFSAVTGQLAEREH
jgi:hypothetical protein